MNTRISENLKSKLTEKYASKGKQHIIWLQSSWLESNPTSTHIDIIVLNTSYYIVNYKLILWVVSPPHANPNSKIVYAGNLLSYTKLSYKTQTLFNSVV